MICLYVHNKRWYNGGGLTNAIYHEKGNCMHPWYWSPHRLAGMISSLGSGQQFEIETKIETLRGPVYECKISDNPKIREFTVVLRWYCRKVWVFDKLGSRVAKWEKVTPSFGGEHCTMRIGYCWFYLQRKNATRGTRVKVRSRNEADTHHDESCRFFSTDDPTNIFVQDGIYTATVIAV